MEELLEEEFSVGPVTRLYNEDHFLRRESEE
jgi:hypothetical protein